LSLDNALLRVTSCGIVSVRPSPPVSDARIDGREEMVVSPAAGVENGAAVFSGGLSGAGLPGTGPADVQGSHDVRRIAIDKVGIKDLRYPVRIQDRDGRQQSTVAQCNVYVSLPHDQKGTHMSRMLEILNTRDRVLSAASFRDLLDQVASRLEAEKSFVEMAFPYFVEKRAPVSHVHSTMDYQAAFIGSAQGGAHRHWTRVTVPATGLSLSSKKLARYGAQNQRVHISLTVETRDALWIEDLIDLAESQASSEVYGVLKRPDEKFVTERAYNNPKFVEDLARDTALALGADSRVAAYLVEVESFESSHTHSGYAAIASPNWRAH
jgi:GTP cyclohydrolase I